jgi:hypothetical protein
MRAERIALGDQALGSPAVDPVRREEVLRHVWIQRSAHDPEAHLDHEWQRSEQHRADCGRGDLIPSARRPLQSKERGTGKREHGHAAKAAPRRRCEIRREPGDGAQKRQPDGRGKRRAVTSPAGAEDRLTDDERSPQDECQRNVGAEHRAASLQPRA